MLDLQCKKCLREYKVHESKEGMTAKCLCGNLLVIPTIPDVIVCDKPKLFGATGKEAGDVLIVVFGCVIIPIFYLGIAPFYLLASILKGLGIELGTSGRK